jgi:hypothetical protein
MDAPSFVLALTPDLLAPGDGKSAELDPSQFEWRRIRSAEHPLFSAAYDALCAEFGAHEVEQRSVLAARFALGLSMRYEMIVAEKDGAMAAVRDHTAVWMENEVVVHLSHLLVMPAWRRSGLAGWMRATPILTAHELAAGRGIPGVPVTLVAEMEYDDGSDPRCVVRLAAYERAGFVKVDPKAVRYHQPDFRSPLEIDATGGPRPPPFQLLLRQVGREHERAITGERLRRLVRALYALYGAQFRPADMAHPLLQLDDYPDSTAQIALVPPTQR